MTEKAVMPRQRLPQQADGPRVDPLCCPTQSRARDRMPQPAGLAQRLHQAAALAIDIIAMAGMQVLRAPGIQLTGELTVRVAEERPFEMGLRE